MYRIGICDDDEKISEWLGRKIAERYSVEIDRFTVDELKEEIEADRALPDILFLDILLGNQNGIALAKSIQKRDSHLQIVFITGYVDYISDVFEAQPIYLLLKPIREDKLYSAMEKALEGLEAARQQVLELRLHEKLLRIPFRDIIYVESDGRYLYIHQTAQTERVTMKLSEMLRSLPSSFLRCHQSYVINMDQVKKFSGKTVELQNGDILPVSRSRYQKVKETVLHYYAGRMQERMENL